MSGLSSPPEQPGSLEAPFNIDAVDADRLWDEYKYRHDLIWRHLIRSTLALVGLVSVRYSTAFQPTILLVVMAWLVALGYWLITLLAIEPELRLLNKVKRRHREHQNARLNFNHEINESAESRYWGRVFLADGFSRRVGVYLLLLLMATFYAGIISLIDPGPVIKMSWAAVSGFF